jgi:hypothetical protein
MMSVVANTVGNLQADMLKRPTNLPTTSFSSAVASVSGVAAVSVIALALPAYLIHHLPVQTYTAWVLIIQLGAYVFYLDVGIQLAAHACGNSRPCTFLGFGFRPTYHGSIRRYYMSRNRIAVFRKYVAIFPVWAWLSMYDSLREAVKCFLGEPPLR